MSTLEAIFRTFLDLSWRFSIPCLLVLALRRWGQGRIPPSLLFGAWLVVLLRLLVPIGIPAKWSPFNLTSALHLPAPVPALPTAEVPPGEPMATVAATVVDIAPIATAAEPLLPADRNKQNLTPWIAGAPLEAPSQKPGGQVLLIAVPAALSRWGAVAWAAVAAVLLSMRFWTSWAFARRARRLREPTGPGLARLVLECAQELGMTRKVEVVVTCAVGAPALRGLAAPELLIPPGLMEQLTESEARLVVLHELGHWRRRDVHADFLLGIVGAVHWFNPLVWIALRFARMDCESACDAFVMRRMPSGGHAAYGYTLLKVLGLAAGVKPAAGAVGIFSQNQSIERRIHMISSYKPSSQAVRVAGCVLLVLCAAIGLTREVAAQQPASAPTNLGSAILASPTGSGTMTVTVSPAGAGSPQSVATGLTINGGVSSSEAIVGWNGQTVFRGPIVNAQVKPDFIVLNRDGTIRSRGIYQNDASGRVIRYSVYDGSGALQYIEVPYYAPDGRIVRGDTFDSSGALSKVAVFFGSVVKVFDASGKELDAMNDSLRNGTVEEANTLNTGARITTTNSSNGFTLTSVISAVSTVSVIGEVNRKGPIPILQGETLLLDEALRRAGDFTDMARREKVEVRRPTPNGVNVREVDLDSIRRGKAPADSIPLMPGDTIFVPMRVF